LIMEGSIAQDLSRAIHEDIGKGLYECFICKEHIGPVSHIWSRQRCRRVLHLSCVKKRLEVKVEYELEGKEYWPCPVCDLIQIGLPRNYTCWCGKQIEPHPTPGLPPHSCGQACSRVSELESPGKSCCDRPCEFICHAGPCPPCGYEDPLHGTSRGREI
jgi:transcriptional repressor NF-X1